MRSIIALALKDLRILVRVKSGLFFTFVWPVIVAILFGFVFSGQSQRRPAAAPRRRRRRGQHRRIAGVCRRRSKRPGTSPSIGRRAPRLRRWSAARSARRTSSSSRGSAPARERMFYGAPRQLEIGNDPARQAGSLDDRRPADQARDGRLSEAVQRSAALAEDGRQGAGRADRGRRQSRHPPAPLRRFLGELDTFLGAPPTAGGGAGRERLAAAADHEGGRRARTRGPANGFEVTFPQGVMWGIIGCVMTLRDRAGQRTRARHVRAAADGAADARHRSSPARPSPAFAIDRAAAGRCSSRSASSCFGIRPSSFPLLALACASAVAGFVGFMMMIAGLGRTEQAVGGAGWAMLMPMTMFGGGMMPQFIMPAWMQTIGNLQPGEVGDPRHRRRGVARLHARRDAATVRDPAGVRRGVLRRWCARPAGCLTRAARASAVGSRLSAFGALGSRLWAFG